MYELYLQIIDSIDPEKVTEVELMTLEEEMANCEDISNTEFIDLMKKLEDKVR